MARKPTKLQQQYKKEIANLKRRIKTAEKRGFFFLNQIIPTPKRIDQRAIKAVQSIRGDKLYEMAQYFVDQSTAEAFDTKGIGHALRRQAALKGLETRKKKKRRYDGGIIGGGVSEPPEELYSAYFKIWNWANNFEPEAYTGKRKYHNRDWEERWSQQASGVEKIKRLLEVTEERYIEEYLASYDGADEMQAQQYAQRRIGKNLKASGIDLDEATEGFTYDSKASTIIIYVNRILGAIIGRPLSMEERMDFTMLEDDGIDYTDEEDFPI